MTLQKWLEDVIAGVLTEGNAVCVIYTTSDKIAKVAYYNTSYNDKAIMKQYLSDDMTSDYLAALQKKEGVSDGHAGLGIAELLGGMFGNFADNLDGAGSPKMVEELEGTGELEGQESLFKEAESLT